MSELTVFSSIASALAALSGKVCPNYRRYAVSGGCIHDSAVYDLDGQRFFIKQNKAEYFPVFQQEAAGLQALNNAGLIPVARPLALGYHEDGAFLVLAYISSGRVNSRTWTEFGTALAQLHRQETNICYGWPPPVNRIGASEQTNTLCDDWGHYFAEFRLRPLLNRALPLLDKQTYAGGEHIIAHLADWLEPPPRPQLIHGDLWSGNVMINQRGEGVLIDPAVYYGHGEADLAMTRLFGGFPEAFYRAYQQISPSPPGLERRIAVYHLYYLLNHLNLFGHSYLNAVQQVIHRLIHP